LRPSRDKTVTTSSSIASRIEARHRSTGVTALRTAAPVGDLGFVDLETQVVGGFETRRCADRAIDVDDSCTDSTDEVVVVVVHTVFVASRRPDGLDSSNHALFHQDAQGVVDGLTRNRTDIECRAFTDLVGALMWLE
jgi:hypothetical protein